MNSCNNIKIKSSIITIILSIIIIIISGSFVTGSTEFASKNEKLVKFDYVVIHAKNITNNSNNNNNDDESNHDYSTYFCLIDVLANNSEPNNKKVSLIYLNLNSVVISYQFDCNFCLIFF